MSEDHEPESQQWTIMDTMAVAFFIVFMFCLIVWVLYALTEM